MDADEKGNIIKDKFYQMLEGEKELEPTSFGREDETKISLKRISDDEEEESDDASVQDIFTDKFMTIPTVPYQNSEPQ